MYGGGRPKKTLAAAIGALALAALLGACAGGSSTSSPSRSEPETQPQRVQATGKVEKPKRVDPRRGGLKIGLGEWALTPEASAIRPGWVNFVLDNRGTMNHGFEIELDGDNSGHGSGDLFKAETELIGPGESTNLVMELPPGIYKIECLVDGHDDMGMEGLLEVRGDAPLKKVTSGAPDRISIVDFAFSPTRARVPTGSEVTWSNEDPTGHTVTAVDGEFGSDTLESGDSFSVRFKNPGLYAYRCAIHPEMKGSVRVN
ncbi:MAG: plastocyanin/azurin family copper-binding protein [Actinomycetota bacterium]